MLDVPEDDEARRATTVGDVEDPLPHDFGAARDPDALFPEFLFEPDVQVRDDEDVIRGEGGRVGHRLYVHGRFKLRVRLMLVCGPLQRNSAKTRPTLSATSTAVSP